MAGFHGFRGGNLAGFHGGCVGCDLCDGFWWWFLVVVLDFLVVVGWLRVVVPGWQWLWFVWCFLVVGCTWWQSVAFRCDWVLGAMVVGSLFIIVVVAYCSGYIILLCYLY